MSPLRLTTRIALLVAIFLGVGFATGRALIHHAVARGAVEYQVRLAGYMTGLFCGGVATLIAGIALALTNRRKP